MKDKKYIIVSIIILIILVCLLVILNLFSLNEKHQLKNTTTTSKVTTTTKALESDNSELEEVWPVGLNNSIYVKKYVTHLGFDFKYPSDYFKVSFLSNGSILIENIYDSKEYIKIEKVDEIDYYKDYDEFNFQIAIDDDNYKTSYKFFKDNSLIFLKITKCVKYNGEIESNISFIIDYIIDSLEFN